jgi:hypothetical protein
MQELFPLESSWIVALASGAVAILMLLELARSLPLQNLVIIVVALMVGEGVLEHFLANYARVEVTGPMWCYLAGAALLWMAVVLSVRRLAQFILRPWRREKVYGIWLIGMSAVFTAAFQYGWPCLNVDPEEEPIPQDKVAIMLAIRALATVVLLTCLVPWFIRKRPVSPAKPSQLAQQPQKEAQ